MKLASQCLLQCELFHKRQSHSVNAFIANDAHMGAELAMYDEIVFNNQMKLANRFQ